MVWPQMPAMPGSSPRVRGTAAGTTINQTEIWDHPRACGEQAGMGFKPKRPEGSSPRVRGTEYVLRLHAVNRGIIPARAGNSYGGDDYAGVYGDHPRACGEQLPRPDSIYEHAGSSPRVRGTVWCADRLICVVGIIPARAGNSMALHRPASVTGDHPRACGEQGAGALIVSEIEGSSPRVRGTAHAEPFGAQPLGIIPARAGNSEFKQAVSAYLGDHPRACGEQRGRRPRRATSRGSSPRVRGTASNIHDKLLDAGIIPARAGNSRFTIRPRSLHRDHPRACGEQRLWHVPPHCRSGSSPRVRGTVLPVVVNAVVQGIIPARAGNSSSPTSPPSSRRDHPRACGEQA